jgi:galactose mutarotase-like enzyme
VRLSNIFTVILGYAILIIMYNLISSNGLSKATVSLLGGQVVSFDFNETSIIYKGSSIKRSGIPILFPYANPLKDDTLLISGKKLGQHGFARTLIWEVINQSINHIKIVLKSSSLPLELQEFYPFDFKLYQTITCLDEGILLNFELINLNKNKPMPIAPGLHPYFSIKNEDKKNLTIKNLNLSTINWDQPTDGYFYNIKNFSTDNFPLIKTNQYSLQLSFTKSVFEQLVIWSQPKTMEDYNFVCIEPFARITDGINQDPIIVTDRLEFDFKITVRLNKG